MYICLYNSRYICALFLHFNQKSIKVMLTLFTFYWSYTIFLIKEPHFIKPIADLLLQPCGFLLFQCGLWQRQYFRGQASYSLKDKTWLLCEHNALPSYFTGSFSFLPLPLNLLIFCPVFFPPSAPFDRPLCSNFGHGNCSFAGFCLWCFKS